MPQSNQTAFVVVIGESPLAVAPTLELAQQDALARGTKYQQPGQFEHRWDEHRPGETRLMQRPVERRGRFSWTRYVIHEVEVLGGGESR